ncbi:MAG: AAA family ATPase [Candidatus Woesearchaeota archaeon]
MIWYRHLGFHNNPFSIKPAAFHDELLGYGHIVEELERDVGSRGIVFIEGVYGEGKTTILKRLLRRFGGKKKIAYFSCNRLEHSLDVKKILNGRYGKVGSWLDLMPKNIILLLDEVQALSREDGEELLKYMRKGNVRSIVFVSSQYERMKFPPEINRLLKRYRLGRISEDDSVKVVRSRVGKLHLLSNDSIRLIFKISNYNVRELLKNCELVCRKAVELEMELADEELIYEVLNQGVPFEPKKKREADIEDVAIEDAGEELPAQKSSEELEHELEEENSLGDVIPESPDGKLDDEEELEQLYY